MKANKRTAARIKRKKRIRVKVKGTSQRPRLTVFKSLNHIYAQIVDDVNGATLAAASTNSKKIREKIKGSCKSFQAVELVGEAIAHDMSKKGIKTVLFDRNGFIYHGKIKALADKVREKGIEF